MSDSKKYNLIELLNSVDEFSVPKIQRDYAQGRVNGSDAELCSEVRSDFINSLHKVLINDEEKLLDYVYGEQTSQVYKPIDGQQRLTTLFLIYWYVGKRENEDVSVLDKFSYEVRDTSKEFCKSLIRMTFDPAKPNISDQIKDSVFYHNAYNHDPTIASMLVVLDEIHKVFNQNYQSGLWSRLTKIRFWCLPLEKFGLTDDLFVKMNARGKKLSRFDVFKSDFESCLENLPGKNQTLEILIENWKKEIDNSFLDSFWTKYGVNYAERNLFRTILFFVKSMIYASSTSGKEDYDSAWEVDESKALYSDIISYINANPNVFSNIYNILSNFNCWNDNAEELSLFIIPDTNTTKGNLRFDKRAQVFARMYWFSYSHGMSCDSDYKQFDRLIKNYICSLRQYDIPPRSYSSSIDNKSYKGFIKFISKLIDDYNSAKSTNSVSFNDYVINSGLKELSDEIEKINYAKKGQNEAKAIEELENVPFLSRNIRNFFFSDTVFLKADVLNDITADENLINKSLRIIFSYANPEQGKFEQLLMDKKTSQSGRKQLYYDGDNDQVTCWKHKLYFDSKAEYGDSIFTSSNAEISGCVKNFSRELSQRIYNQGKNTSDAIEELFCDRLKCADFTDQDNVQWYIIKYDEFFYNKTGTTLSVNRRKDYFQGLNDDNIYGMQCLNDDFDFNSPHYQPFYKALSGKLTGPVTVQSKLEYTGIEIEYAHPCKLSNGWNIHIENTGNWTVYFPGNIPPSSPISGLKIIQDSNGDSHGEIYCTGKDSIEIMANIINSLP